MLLPETLHLCNGFTLVYNEFLVPHRSERLEFTSVLLLNLHLFAGMFVYKRMLEARFSLLPDLHNALQLQLSLAKVTLALIYQPLCI